MYIEKNTNIVIFQICKNITTFFRDLKVPICCRVICLRLWGFESPCQLKKQSENDGLNYPADETDTDCSPSTIIIKRLPDSNDHRHKHSDTNDEIKNVGARGTVMKICISLLFHQC
jgi:hypothetical protein